MIKLNDMRNAVHDALNDTVRNPSMGQLLKKKMKISRHWKTVMKEMGFIRWIQ